mgnify:FL=1
MNGRNEIEIDYPGAVKVRFLAIDGVDQRARNESASNTRSM